MLHMPPIDSCIHYCALDTFNVGGNPSSSSEFDTDAPAVLHPFDQDLEPFHPREDGANIDIIYDPTHSLYRTVDNLILIGQIAILIVQDTCVRTF